MSWENYDENQTPQAIAARAEQQRRQAAYTAANRMSREDFLRKYGTTFVADDRGGNAASEVAGQDVGAYYDQYLAEGATGDSSGFGWKYRDANPYFDAWDNVDPHPESQDLGGVGEFWRQIGRPVATAVAMYYGVGALNGLAGGAAGGAGSTAGGGALGAGADFGMGTYGAGLGGETAALSGSQIAALSPAASGGGFSFATPEIMTAGTGVDLGAIGTTAIPSEAALGFSGIGGGTGGSAGIGSGTALGGGGASAGSGGLGGIWDKATNYISDPSNLMKIGGTILGAGAGAAASGDKTTSTSSNRDPWGPAQPYLLDNLKTNAAAQEYYRQNPFSDLQKQQYQGLFNNLATNQANVPGLLANASNFGKSNRGVMPAMNGLLSNTQAPAIDWTQYQNIGRKG